MVTFARIAQVMVGVLALASPAVAADAAPQKLRHGYVDNRYGQLHYAIAQPATSSQAGAGGAAKPPIVLLHQSPNSSAEFDDLTLALGRDRVAIAIDTPGHGGSDGPETIPTIEDYAAAIVEGLTALGYGPNNPVDLFGFHTGSRTATEIAVAHPKLVRSVILGLSPYGFIDDAMSKKLYDEVYHPTSSADLLQRFCTALPARIARAEKGAIPDAAMGRVAVATLRGLTRHEFGHAAAFEYGPRFKTRILDITQPVGLFVVDDPIDSYQGGKTALSTSQDVKALMTKAKAVTIIDDDYRNNSFFVRPGDIAEAFRGFVDGTR
ncbi:MAG: alpha/beta fold hydrolase [Rhodospirillaceae bacterium]|nr:alpha/beta fold hydrolase [Rhodospirillaceae bacterium]